MENITRKLRGTFLDKMPIGKYIYGKTIGECEHRR